MRLSKIKLVGFKSFVDPTVIDFPSNLVGIIGPNGCGKSNVIDAVRWVMGESSAKTLRGDSMADVIFNGSTARKPVGTASIELMFDNAEGMAGGQYASYAEISVKREVTRDGTSNYFLNGTRCRRRDITDLFLGTGLGPRSYAIIEQGTISRLVESKPDELRVFLEEAAGISKYKERRKETENRIRHTKENLDRLNDLRDEIEKQLQHLQRQARAAERYKKLKENERELQAQVLALRWRRLDTEVEGHDRFIRERDLALEAAVAAQRKVEKEAVQAREKHEQATDAFNEVQGRYYELGAGIARLEQALQSTRELRKSQQADLEQAENNFQEVYGHIQRDRARLREIEASMAELAPGVDRAQQKEQELGEALNAAEAAMQDWQSSWETFNQKAADSGRAAQVEKAQIELLERQLSGALQRVERLQQEREQFVPHKIEQELEELSRQNARAGEDRDRLQAALDEVLTDIASKRSEEHRLDEALHEQRKRVADHRGSLASLLALQQQALGKSREAITKWLGQAGLEENSRLAEVIQVSEGWERAVETVLGFYLEAVCVDEIGSLTGELENFTGGSLTLMETRSEQQPVSASMPTLAGKVTGVAALHNLLSNVFIVNSPAEAARMRVSLGPGQSVITPEGIWLGSNWARVMREQNGRTGVIEREQEIKQLRADMTTLETDIEKLAGRQLSLQQNLNELETRRESLQTEVNQAHRAHSDVAAQVETRRTRLEQVRQRMQAIDTEHNEIQEQVEQAETEIKHSRGKLEEALSLMEEQEQERADMSADRGKLRDQLENARAGLRQQRDLGHELALKLEAKRSTYASTGENLQRMESQLSQLDARRAALAKSLEDGIAPMHQQQQELNELLARRRAVENELSQARKAVEALDEQLRELEQSRSSHEAKTQALRSELEQFRLSTQEIRVRRQTIIEQLEAQSQQLETLLAALPEDADIAVWEEQLEEVGLKIQRLGAINLAAIDEFNEQSERKLYLDRQFQDLTDALATLENAIRKIDRETRNRFRETFDKVNAGLQATFPRLFGGGHAYLELTGEELLDAGVAIMARPPGKRNSTIHLLSGGEKALTAVALVFSIFELNPAPFCMLDEVDAPLDEANIGRFCDLVREMSEHVQFIFITHNKGTMEMAMQLTGVTMNEPGVSRLVTVDIEEAAQMAAM